MFAGVVGWVSSAVACRLMPAKNAFTPSAVTGLYQPAWVGEQLLW